MEKTYDYGRTHGFHYHVPYYKAISTPMMGTESWKVRDIIDDTTQSWNEVVVRELFTEIESEKILHIPIHYRLPPDKMIWSHGQRGVYDVKSGYRVALSLLPINHGLASSSSNNDNGRKRKSLWSIIWKARVLPKIRSFIWRLGRGILPTREALAKKIRGLNTSCAFCSIHEETDLHIFRDCDVTVAAWQLSPLRRGPRDSPSPSIYLWLEEVCNSLDDNQCCLFFSILWALWVERNRRVFDGGSFTPQNTVTWAINLLEEYQNCHPMKAKIEKRSKVRWQFPPSGRLKANVDASFDPDSGSGGIGVVVRNEHGNVVVAKSFHMTQGISAFHLEVVAVRSALLLACEHGWAVLDVESDCALVVSAFHQDGEEISEVGQIIEDFKTLASLITSCSVMHIYREENGVANRLARIARMSLIDSI